MVIPKYKYLNRKTGEEHFHIGEEELNVKLLNFWSWGQSDILNNSLRGVLAEYIVATALGVNAGVRVEWDGIVKQMNTPLKLKDNQMCMYFVYLNIKIKKL